MAKRKATDTPSISNKRVRFDFAIKQTYQAGIVLSGAETKSLRNGRGNLRGAFVNIMNGELWLLNATISPLNTNQSEITQSDQTKPRKLLVSKRELNELINAKEQNLTIVPLRILTKSRYIKVEIATAKGLKKYDKRQVIKKRDSERDIARRIKA